MSWFKNLKIKVKLVLSFIVLAIITGVVGVVGITSMSAINTSGKQIYTNNFIPSTFLSNYQNNLQTIRALHSQLLYNHDPKIVENNIAEINKLVDQDNKYLEDYKKTMSKGQETTLYNNVLDSLNTYRNERGLNIDLIKSGKIDQATADYDKVDQARVQLFKDVGNIINYNINKAHDQLNKNNDDYSSKSTIMIALIVFGIIMALLLGLYIASIISKPMNKLVGAANKISDGDLDVDINITSKDEVGMLGQAFKKMSDNINHVMSDIQSASEQVASGAKQVSDSSMELSQGATEQASSIEQLTASIEEISSQTKHNALNAANANELAESAQRDAEQGNERMTQMLRSMEDINESSSNISKIIKVIDEIAFQTNILALNAAVEAARAGQHGKGFAVVAEEVRNLAARSADAAKETTALIEGSIKKVEGGTKIATETAEALHKIVDGVAQVSGLVSDIATASNEQASGIAQINQGIMQVSQVVQTNSATSEESAAASEELSSQAEILRSTVRRFKLKKSGSSYSRPEAVNPEVLRMIEQMENSSSFKEAAATKKIIDLSDRDFGKY